MTTASLSRPVRSRRRAGEVLPLEEAVVLLQEAEEKRSEAERELKDVLARLGLGA